MNFLKEGAVHVRYDSTAKVLRWRRTQDGTADEPLWNYEWPANASWSCTVGWLPFTPADQFVSPIGGCTWTYISVSQRNVASFSNLGASLQDMLDGHEAKAITLSDGQYATFEYVYVKDVGNIFDYYDAGGSAGTRTSAQRWLTYARVGGQEYGTMQIDREAAGAPMEMLALAASPNPTSTNAAVEIVLGQSTNKARVEVFDALGRRVAVLHDAPLSAGEYRLTLDAARLPAGLYLVRAQTERTSATARLVVVR